MSRPLIAAIDFSALRHNLGVVRLHAKQSRVLAVIKANAYGHGVARVTRVLADAGVSRDPPRNQFKPAASPGAARGSSDAGAELSVKSVTLTRLGLIDTYV